MSKCKTEKDCTWQPWCRLDAQCYKASASPDGVAAATHGTHRRVVCAAIRAADGDVLLGIRHYSADMHWQIGKRSDGSKFVRRHDEDQGFVDQRGVFMSRGEAYAVALAAGQIVYPTRCGADPDGPKLYSEGLY